MPLPGTLIKQDHITAKISPLSESRPFPGWWRSRRLRCLHSPAVVALVVISRLPFDNMPTGRRCVSTAEDFIKFVAQPCALLKILHERGSKPVHHLKQHM